MTDFYKCPSCGTGDPNAYTRCNRASCPDGRDLGNRKAPPAKAAEDSSDRAIAYLIRQHKECSEKLDEYLVAGNYRPAIVDARMTQFKNLTDAIAAFATKNHIAEEPTGG